MRMLIPASYRLVIKNFVELSCLSIFSIDRVFLDVARAVGRGEKPILGLVRGGGRTNTGAADRDLEHGSLI
jgi:hypothetical protein